MIMNWFLILSITFGVALARPEPPRSRYSVPQAPPSRQQLPRQNYGPPTPSDSYGPPTQGYGPPSTPSSSYGPPSDQQTITKNVYVHLPPEDIDDYQPPKVIQSTLPQKHYKLIFIKAPEPPKPQSPIIPPQPQDEHKTLVYVLVKKPDPQPDIVLPSPDPTPPAKPEVYFIKYKKEDKPVYGLPKPDYGPPPSSEYGSPSL